MESWPALLTRHLTRSGCEVELVVNPARTGWTTRDAIEQELSQFRAAQPDFGTLMLGVNDWVQGVPATTFRFRLGHIMDEMRKVLPNEKRLLVINIPDFSVTPAGPELRARPGYPRRPGRVQRNHRGGSEAQRIAAGGYFSSQPGDGDGSVTRRAGWAASLGQSLRGLGGADFSGRAGIVRRIAARRIFRAPVDARGNRFGGAEIVRRVTVDSPARAVEPAKPARPNEKR